MQVKFFVVPLADRAEAEAELNAFLRGHRVVRMEKHFVGQETGAYWALAVEFLERGGGEASHTIEGRIDYKTVLSEADFAVFRRLRDLRKELADAEGLPAFAVFTNAQLAAMVQRRVTSRRMLSEIDGIGEAKTTKYAERFLAALIEAFGETSGQPVPEDHRSG